MTPAAPHITAWFRERLPVERRVSPHACDADAFQLLLTFAAGRIGVAPSDLALEHLDAPLILAFLEHLQRDRRKGSTDHCASRNTSHHRTRSEDGVFARRVLESICGGSAGRPAAPTFMSCDLCNHVTLVTNITNITTITRKRLDASRKTCSKVIGGPGDAAAIYVQSPRTPSSRATFVLHPSRRRHVFPAHP